MFVARLMGRKDLGRNAFDPVEGRRGQSDNSRPEVCLTRCMPLTASARHRPAELRRAETGTTAQKTAQEETGNQQAWKPHHGHHTTQALCKGHTANLRETQICPRAG